MTPLHLHLKGLQNLLYSSVFFKKCGWICLSALLDSEGHKGDPSCKGLHDAVHFEVARLVRAGRQSKSIGKWLHKTVRLSVMCRSGLDSCNYPYECCPFRATSYSERQSYLHLRKVDEEKNRAALHGLTSDAAQLFLSPLFLRCKIIGAPCI